MFSSKKGNIILSLLVAIALWVYVVGEIDPTVTQSYRGVPITLVNEEGLLENNLAVLSQSTETIDVTLSGKRSVINQIDVEDIIATVDLTDALEGENEFKINVRAPEDTEIEDRSLNNITIVVEESISQEKNVEVAYTGTFADDAEPTTVDVNLETVTVTGARSLVENIDHVSAPIDAEQVNESLRTVNSQLVAVDGRGNEVKNVRLSSERATVSTVLSMIKTVPLNVSVTDSGAGDVEREYSAPRTIVIKGNSEDLARVDEIDAEDINISAISENTEIDIVPVLPEGISISDRSAHLVLTVTVTSHESKTFTIDGEDINISGVGDGLTARVETASVVVTITGTQAQVDAVTAADIRLSANLSGLAAGTHQVDLEATCGKTVAGLTTDVVRIRVVIE